ncbi:AEC family transporter [Corynebacterium heidelbergense]|uniref:AEC family transporter n=1 Tax=Corynebacterium heidelbergense TaxID=2055947 RepID=A0A364V664_9CORY|nr:AEC family transporter [Corynebacterium heidelbergense]RAV32143.1 AEC family transporter [Corynebacterium heidelbergense]
MLNVLTGFAVVVLIIALGYLLGKRRLLGPHAVYPLNMFVFWIALPATLVEFLSRTDVAALFGPNLAVVALSTLFAAAIGYCGSRWIARRATNEALVAMLACSYCNGSNLGIPLAAHLLKDPTLTLPVILFQVAFFGPLSVVLLDLTTPSDGRGPGRQPAKTASAGRILRDVLLGIIRNPLIISAAIGIAIGLIERQTTWHLPHVLAEPVHIIASATVGVALIAFGMSMAEVRVLAAGESPRRSVWAAAFIKAVVHPLIAWTLGAVLFHAEGSLLLAMVVVAALPTGQNVFTYAQRFTVNTVLARDTAVVSTAMSIPAMTVFVLLLS